MIKFSHDNFLMFSEGALREWLLDLAKREGFQIRHMEYNFVDAHKMLSLNQEYLNHDTHTDIITFDYSTNKQIEAEVYISQPALLENAELNTQTPEKEALRLLSHALLHCVGYNDKSDEDKLVMRSKEEEYMNLFHVKH
ncbi:MAG: rRNA maturation RNase YbeY [Flavobacteriaceae bacterium]